MSFVLPSHSRTQVSRAGKILSCETQPSNDELDWAWDVLSNWRASHAYPINTFQALLRLKASRLEKGVLVAQRLKRADSIVVKLRRFPGMDLARMQDIAGLRAVVSNVQRVHALDKDFRNSRVAHRLATSKDYIAEPKADGYRGVHLVFRYSNRRAPAYENLQLELQLRTKTQHAWATAVETMGTFLGQALKQGAGDPTWREFFRLSSAAIAANEDQPVGSGFEGLTLLDLCNQLRESEERLGVLGRLQGFAIAASHISQTPGRGTYHLIVLDSESRRVKVQSYSQARLLEASEQYEKFERRAREGERIEAVLVAGGKVSDLKRAYPNYFLDTQQFSRLIRRLTKM